MLRTFDKVSVKGLPVNTFFGSDNKLTVLKNSLKFNSSTEINLPFVVVTDNDGNIVFFSIRIQNRNWGRDIKIFNVWSWSRQCLHTISNC